MALWGMILCMLDYPRTLLTMAKKVGIRNEDIIPMDEDDFKDF